jgi:DNA-binding protein
MSEEAIIFVGNKPPMRYVTAIITAFNQENIETITLKARGKSISRAVDAAEIASNRFISGLETPTISIDTEQLPAMNGGTRGVSTISISFKLPPEREAIEREFQRPRIDDTEPESDEDEEADKEMQ